MVNLEEPLFTTLDEGIILFLKHVLMMQAMLVMEALALLLIE